MKDILVYSFTHTKIRNISCEVMNELKHVDRFAIDCTTNEIVLKQTADLLSLITDVRYKYILGIGIYSGTELRNETLAKNKFRNTPVVINAPEYYYIGEFIQDMAFKISERMGNSWCNMTAYVIRNCIVSNKLLALNGFIHIPNDVGGIPDYAKTIQHTVDTLSIPKAYNSY